MGRLHSWNAVYTLFLSKHTWNVSRKSPSHMDPIFVRKDKLNLSATKPLDASLVAILVNDEYRSLRAVLNPKNSPGKVSPQVFYHPHWSMRG
jgi:hypothetical protein